MCGLTVPNSRVRFEQTREVLTLDQMMAICQNTDNFDYTDEQVNGRTTRTFNYRLDIFESFAQVGGRNFRGTVYDVESKELLALPFHKFFNIYQSPFTQKSEIQEWQMDGVYEKVDGTLVYFYMVNNQLVARTKRRCNNKFAIGAMRIVNKKHILKSFIKSWIKHGYTPIFELISPMSQVVVRYDFEDLVFLALRNMKTGKIHYADMSMLPLINNEIVSVFPIADRFSTLDEVIAECKTENFGRDEVLEGYVVQFTNNEIVKVKRPQWISYASLHDLSRIDKCSVELLFAEKLDDALYEFKDNQAMLSYINNIVRCVDETWNAMLHGAKTFYETNKALDRKSYAVKGQGELEKMVFPLAMLYYLSGGYPDLRSLQESYIKRKGWRESPNFTEMAGDIE